MRARAFVCAAVCVAVTLSAGVALAALFEPGWPLPDPAPVTLGFGESYISPDGTSVVHRGVDLAAPAGSAVVGVLGGTVTFAGRVPAGEGATTIAVTVESGDVRLTYMPLSEAAVVAGEAIAAGSRAGTLAANGDRSHPDPHLHLSARRGSLYIDPMPFLLAPLTSVGDGASEPVPATALPEATSVAPSAVQVPSVAPVTATQPQSAPTPAPEVPVSSVAPAAQSAGVAGLPALALSTVPRSDAMGQPSPGTEAPSTAKATSGHPTGAAAGPRILDSLPAPAAAVLTVDRRAALLGDAPLPFGAIAGIAAALGGVLLWPLWRSAPILSVPVVAERDDVAAVVAR
ncbi:MAG: peptidoglycan DD-metalloendopeptidase family protein [Coriobacteriia bacterium]|nr:peptidoglycan DD-metalloendopeptidase family protein [Coriobacteriia bacterium]